MRPAKNPPLEDLLTKSSSYRAFQAGYFGNKPRTWNSVKTMRESRYTGPVTLRYASPDSRWCRYGVTQADLTPLLARWSLEGCDLSLIRPNESAPDDHLTIQGEFMLTERGVYLRYNTDKVGMRKALETPRHATGLEANFILKRWLDPSSLEDMFLLADLYPGAVIEFSTYRIQVGTVPHRNTLFWEVRRF